MANSTLAINLTLQNEGGFVDNPADPGGATKYGITQADMPGVNIADITEAQAIVYYEEHYWKPLYSQIESQGIANKLFDMGVLFGIGTAVKLLQITLKITDDGDFGPETLAEVNASDAASLLQAYKVSLATHAVAVVSTDVKTKPFLRGWINRINS